MFDIAVTTLAASAAPRHQKLQKAAVQFEAVMLQELMKPLSKGSSLEGDESESSANSLQSYGVEAMAGALARSGAMGFANRIVRSVEAHDTKTIPNEKVLKMH